MAKAPATKKAKAEPPLDGGKALLTILQHLMRGNDRSEESERAAHEALRALEASYADSHSEEEPEEEEI